MKAGMNEGGLNLLDVQTYKLRVQI
jgi:hypothetical protein